jgi:hypothetical protein
MFGWIRLHRRWAGLGLLLAIGAGSAAAESGDVHLAKAELFARLGQWRQAADLRLTPARVSDAHSGELLFRSLVEEQWQVLGGGPVRVGLTTRYRQDDRPSDLPVDLFHLEVAVGLLPAPQRLQPRRYFPAIAASPDWDLPSPGALDRSGLLQSAAGGTLVLDDIHCLPLEVQGAPLRALESRMVRPVGAQRDQDVIHHTIATTSRDLSLLVAEGNSPPDLHSRLISEQMVVPPLRRRPEDIIPLARRLAVLGRRKLQQLGAPIFSEDACRRLQCHDCRSGNVCELEQTVNRALVRARGGEILAEDIIFARSGLADAPATTGRSASERDASPVTPREIKKLKSVLLAAERSHLQVAIATGLEPMELCPLLGISKTTFYAKLKARGLLLRG